MMSLLDRIKLALLKWSIRSRGWIVCDKCRTYGLEATCSHMHKESVGEFFKKIGYKCTNKYNHNP
jgi:hypothetical protein